MNEWEGDSILISTEFINFIIFNNYQFLNWLIFIKINFFKNFKIYNLTLFIKLLDYYLYLYGIGIPIKWIRTTEINSLALMSSLLSYIVRINENVGVVLHDLRSDEWFLESMQGII